jgi:hypothetical protein
MSKKKTTQTSENSNKRTASEFLPKYFRTETNKKFLDATLDQLISEGTVEKVNGYLGRKTAKAYKPLDNYVDSVISNRNPYRLEPSLVIEDDLGNVTFFKDYVDYINQLKSFNSNSDNHDTLNSQETYSWNPHIDWDKLVNYREYYWLPNGPQAIAIKGQSTEITSTYTVTISDEGDNQAYVFTPDGLTRNPTLKLYKGQTYRFEIDCPGHPIAFSTTRSFIPNQSLIISTEQGVETGGLFDLNNYDLAAFDLGPWLYSTVTATGDTGPFNLYNIWSEGVTSATVYVEKGTIEFTIPENAPDVMYYVSKNNINTSGLMKLYSIDEATSIDVEKEIIGKKTYTINDFTELSNGMKVYFTGQVTPSQYARGNWYVEGVGKSIRLVAEEELLIVGPYNDNSDIEFDNEGFSTQGFDANYAFSLDKDYVVINRASSDSNQWSRNNKWFHRSVIDASAAINGVNTELDETSRARRPIIEFEAGLKLFNHGYKSKKSVDLIDTVTLDVFGSAPVGGVTSGVEGSLGYTVDGVELVPGMRVLFTADTDRLVNGRIFRVGTVTHLGIRRLTLLEEPDSQPFDGESIVATLGKTAGTIYHYTNSRWKVAQQKTKVNQSPLFDVFDINGISYGNREAYLGSTFNGTAILSYKPGSVFDNELKQFVSYKNIENIGDIEFNFNLHHDSFQYQLSTTLIQQKIEFGYLQKYNGLQLETVNGWETSNETSSQWVLKQYDVTSKNKNFFLIDTYDVYSNNTEVRVFVNNVRQNFKDFEIQIVNNKPYVQLFKDAEVNDIVLIKTKSNITKNNNGYYEFPTNLEDNPLNKNLSSLTFGQIIDHVTSLVENLTDFQGKVLGINNLRDLGEVSKYGKKILQHSSSLLPVMYHVTNKKHNVILAIKYASSEYEKFKRNFFKTAETLGFDGEIDLHLDLILVEMFKDKDKTMPFYLSDVLGYKNGRIFRQEVIDDSVTDYPLLFNFNLNAASNKSVLIYLNQTQLVHGVDYEFINDNFVRIYKVTTGDDLKIVQYETTDGCYIPPTPTTLGIYPKFVPYKFIDDTYQIPQTVIQGHDGSIVIGYNDYRDDLLLELEKRIYNNIKVNYDGYLLKFLPGYFRQTDVSREQLNSTIVQEFLKWNKLINQDYTVNDFYNQNNPWTFNYDRFTAKDEETLVPGFWRGVYKFAYDTDRPHTHPWEILGYSEKPTWWEKEYGPAPYTKDNLILWTDIAEGRIKDSKFPRFDPLVARPSILTHLPVDSAGNLVNPLNSGFITNFYNAGVDLKFVFGDHSPVETAWRRSSSYPFALILAMTLLKPAEMFARTFDKIRQIKSPNGQIVYRTNNGDERFSTSNVVFPSIELDKERVFTSGLVNYITEYVTKHSINLVNTYRQEFKRIDSKIASKLEGYVSKDKFRLILDSRTPLNDGNVFIPTENYKIILNTSSPVNRVVYSGVIIEKAANGFIINGYSTETSEFKYFKALTTVSDSSQTIGGISASFVNWGSDRYYAQGTIVKYDNNYYRTLVEHRSSNVFELKYFSKLQSLPVEGGRTVTFRTRFESTPSILYYGDELETIQDVADFLLGYGKYLESQGFIFESYNSRLQTVVNWSTSVKEFAFWTTQNWNVNSAISVSPAAQEVVFDAEYVVPDDIYNGFYEYSVYKQDGNVLDTKFTNSSRSQNLFSIGIYDSSDGIYHLALDLVSKEHVLILDDTTIFNDVIYEKTSGYRQERIKVIGYKSSDWQGSFSVPGFIFDNVIVRQWAPWEDYSLGDTVKYKEFYYSAFSNVPGSAEFDATQWFRLPNKPESNLIPNWEYRANQFADFYDLDTDSFDADQQKFAQHLIGYQNRKYLENIINDDVAQYKFYQGMIREKGTKNSLSKMFDALNFSQQDSIEFHEYWALRLGQYGASDAFDEYEINLEEQKFKINPQPIELTRSITPDEADLVYRILPNQMYIVPEGYNHTLFPLATNRSTYLPTAGYVNPEDVTATVVKFDDIASLSVNQLKDGSYIWVAYDKNATWNVRRFTAIESKITSASVSSTGIKFVYNLRPDSDIQIGDYFAIKTSIESLNGIFKVTDVNDIWIEIENKNKAVKEEVEALLSSPSFICYKFSSWRFTTIDDPRISTVKHRKNELLWIDNNLIDWKVWKYDPTLIRQDIAELERGFASNFVVSADNLTLITTNRDISRFGAASNRSRLSHFVRANENDEWVSIAQIYPDKDIPYNTRVVSPTFGDSLNLSNDGLILSVGIPGIGISQGSTNQGLVVVYRRTPTNYFYEVDTIYNSPSNSSNQYFGFKTKIYDKFIFIAAKGSLTALAKIYKFILGESAVEQQIEFNNLELVDFVVSKNHIVVSLSDSTVMILNHNFELIQNLNQIRVETISNSVLTITSARNLFEIQSGDTVEVTATEMPSGLSSQVTYFVGSLENTNLKLYKTKLDAEKAVNHVVITSSGSNVTLTKIQATYKTIGFGKAIDITVDDLYIAVGAPSFNRTGAEQGMVLVYEQSDNEYSLSQAIVSDVKSEFFGSTVKFFNSRRLVVLGAGGKQSFDTQFDNENTTFDAGSTDVIDPSAFIGTVKIFDRYDSNFIFSGDVETLVTNSKGIDSLGENYGKNIQVVNKHIYISDSRITNGFIYEYRSSDKPWSIYKAAADTVDLEKIKSIFLYNTETDMIAERLDFIDNPRGKIAGIAEQELSFKTMYDPATYSQGNEEVLVDDLTAWNSDHVGQLWWDLDAVRFIESNQSSIVYKSNNWNNIFPGTDVLVYEWVASDLLPEQRDRLADTEEGLARNISGKSKYGNTAYSVERQYDNISKTFKNIYYYWVANPTIVPNIESRKISANDVANYILDPKAMGLRYAVLLDKNQFSLVNCNNLLLGKKLNLNVRTWAIENREANIHSHYQIISETGDLKDINPYIELKWFDSLIGFDKFGNTVPDSRLPEKLKYGILNKPRQSMFVNQVEALKQFIERINSVLAKNLIADDFQYPDLYSKEEAPTIDSGVYDTVISTFNELRFIDVAGIKTAVLQPVVEKGRITRVIVINPGRKYITPPTITVAGTGQGAELRAELDVKGQIKNVIVVKSGQNYDTNTRLTVRNFAVLVTNDNSSNNKWTIYTFGNDLKWFKSRTQIFDTTLYWHHIDWYETGYNQFTKIDYIVDFVYEILFEEVKVGEIVKVNNQGSGGWILLEKVKDSQSFDLSVDFKTIGRQNGTIEFKSSLYSFKNSQVGFDGPIFDSEGYDEQPKDELRIILNTLKSNILVDQLKPEFKKAFFASLRYALTEQETVDWAFKTSFISGKHNLGKLDQPSNFKNNNIFSYRDYIEEVKPYSTKIKEFVSAYETLDNTGSKVTDFDLPARYNRNTREIEAIRTTVSQGLVETSSEDIEKEPYVDWYDNVGFGIDSIDVFDQGRGYLTAPKVNIVGPAASPAVARAFISDGKISRIEVEDPGSGYITTPTIEIVGPLADNGVHARAYPILSNSLSRSNNLGVRFDRITSKFIIQTLNVTETFIGTGNRITFDLKWPIDITLGKTSVKIFLEELLSSDYRVENILDKSLGYDRYVGRIIFEVAPPNLNTITITYNKNINLLNAADRIQYYYQPTVGMLAADLGQLMTGVDYGGVEVTGLNFDVGSGWDAVPWSISGWDNLDENFTDFIVRTDSERSWTLPYTPSNGELINIYWSGQRNNVKFSKRIDDVNFDIIQPLVLELREVNENIEETSETLDNQQEELVLLNLSITQTTQQIISVNDQLTQLSQLLAATNPNSPTFSSILGQYNSLLSFYNFLNSQLFSLSQERNQLQIDIQETAADLAQAETQQQALTEQLNQAPMLANPNALMNTFVGDGSTNTIVIPPELEFVSGELDTIIFRKSTSDGSFKPDDKILDVNLSGGNLSYQTARGLLPEEIIVDGDKFVSKNNSNAPEEVIPGQVLETLDIAVYDRPFDNLPFILFDSYKVNGNRLFEIKQPLQNSESLFVKLDNVLLRQDIDYRLNYSSNSITLLTDISEASTLLVISFGKNTKNVLAIDSFISDGVKTEFITLAKEEFDYSIVVTVDGKEIGIENFINENKNIGFRLLSSVSKNSLIEYIVLRGSDKSISKMQKQHIVADGGATYTLNPAPLINGPISNSAIVELDNKILRSNNTQYFTATTSRNYFINNQEYPFNTLIITNLEVYVNGIKKSLGVEYDWNPRNNQLRFREFVVSEGDRIAVSILNTGEYRVEGNQLIFNQAPNINSVITITTFTNHNSLEIERTSQVIRSKSVITPNTADYYRYNQLRTGILRLPKTVSSIYSVWLVKDGNWLIPYTDYSLDDTKSIVRINPDLIEKDTSIFELIIFKTDRQSGSFGYRIFKDLLNRTNYLRINDNKSTLLSKIVTPYSTEIQVINATGLPEPDVSKNKPGIILVNSERIEYFRKVGNTLSQLRRGTLGTGIPNEHTIDSLVRATDFREQLPYKDEYITSVMVVDDNQSLIVPIDFVPKVKNSTLNDASWFRDSIPNNYGQCDEIEVFVGGHRLRKQPMLQWNNNAGQDSPVGDEILEAEFSVDGISSEVRLTKIPPKGAKVTVQKKIGRRWSPNGVSIKDSVDEVAVFIKNAVADIPGTGIDKYKVELLDTDKILLIEDGSGPLTDENGNPLETE